MLAIYDWFGYDLPIGERYRLIREAGFDGVLLWWSAGFGRGDYKSGPEHARNAGLVIENIHAPIEQQDDLWRDGLDGEAMADCYLRCVADCAEFEIPTMVVHLPGDDHPHTEPGLDRLKRIADLAQRRGVNVALENLRNLANLEYALLKLDSPRIGFCYDCGHHYRYAPGNDLLSKYGRRMMALHLHDNNGQHSQHGLPFDGTTDWPATMRNIAKTGYAGATAIEAMNWDYADLTTRAFLREAAARAKRLDAMRRSE